MYIDVLNYGCGYIGHTFGILVSGCIHTHVNCEVEYIRPTLMRMLIYQTMFENVLILRQSSTDGFDI